MPNGYVEFTDNLATNELARNERLAAAVAQNESAAVKASIEELTAKTHDSGVLADLLSDVLAGYQSKVPGFEGPLVGASNIKFRPVRHAYVHVGNPDFHNRMIHVTLDLGDKNGRPKELRQDLGSQFAIAAARYMWENYGLRANIDYSLTYNIPEERRDFYGDSTQVKNILGRVEDIYEPAASKA